MLEAQRSRDGQVAGRDIIPVTRVLHGVSCIFDVKKIHEWLMDVSERLMMLASVPPDKPLVSRDATSAFYEALKAAGGFLEVRWGLIIPIFYGSTFYWLYESVIRLYRIVHELQRICHLTALRLVDIHPNPCDMHTLDFYVEWIIRDFTRLAERARIETDIEERGRELLESLRQLSSACVQATGVNCLKYANPEGVMPMPLRAYVLDLASATELVSHKFLEAYRDVREWRVGNIRLYEHPKATSELSELAEYIANILHKMVETGIVSPTFKYVALVLTTKDKIEVIVSGRGGMILKPRWIIDAYWWEDESSIVRRILAERGFVPEKTDRGLRVTVSPDKVTEAVKIVCLLPAVPSPFVDVRGHKHAYWITMSKLELLESRLKEQKPLKKRKDNL